ncbi:division/cell wall cluster transcriptional repressor MraZ [Anaerolineales bacterium HSG6]|nr:division/cell wall cluster transcriptional repressor MraZ [Anaerolineales bacterium HSG6]MDM8529641.1 division/cell wall cluster transcriptional repressor MraZ [Anaerolineales bacterium HSG25]
MFLGEFEHTIDDKGRLTIPAKFREELRDGIVITRGLDGCLWAYTRSEWERLAEKISKLPSTNRPARNFARFMFSSAADSIPDRQGRILVTQNLRDYADIKNETIIIGVMNRIEIWNPTKWAKVIDEVEDTPESIVSQLEDIDF